MGYREDRSETGLVETLKTQAQGNHPAAICHTLSQSVTIFLLRFLLQKKKINLYFFFFLALEIPPHGILSQTVFQHKQGKAHETVT